jgi:hypothetical protein
MTFFRSEGRTLSSTKSESDATFLSLCYCVFVFFLKNLLLIILSLL